MFNFIRLLVDSSPCPLLDRQFTSDFGVIFIFSSCPICINLPLLLTISISQSFYLCSFFLSFRFFPPSSRVRVGIKVRIGIKLKVRMRKKVHMCIYIKYRVQENISSRHFSTSPYCFSSSWFLSVTSISIIGNITTHKYTVSPNLDDIKNSLELITSSSSHHCPL